MASRWQLSKESMKGFDLLNASADTLFVLEQLETKRKSYLEKEEIESLSKGRVLLEKLGDAVRSQLDKSSPVDTFALRAIMAIEEAMGLRPSELMKKIRLALMELEGGKASSETHLLLENICEQLMSLTARRVEALSPSLHLTSTSPTY